MSSKITIIGAGSVGSTIAYTLASEAIASMETLIFPYCVLLEIDIKFLLISSLLYQNPLGNPRKILKYLKILT